MISAVNELIVVHVTSKTTNSKEILFTSNISLIPAGISFDNWILTINTVTFCNHSNKHLNEHALSKLVISMLMYSLNHDSSQYMQITIATIKQTNNDVLLKIDEVYRMMNTLLPGNSMPRAEPEAMTLRSRPQALTTAPHCLLKKRVPINLGRFGGND